MNGSPGRRRERLSGSRATAGQWDVPNSGYDFDVALLARIDLEVIGKLAAESYHLDGLALT